MSRWNFNFYYKIYSSVHESNPAVQPRKFIICADSREEDKGSGEGGREIGRRVRDLCMLSSHTGILSMAKQIDVDFLI